jgi:LuxR family transcriptional regulator, maltose regulon positive regulatory protein
MTDDLLRTKLFKPPLKPSLIHRDRLILYLNKGIQENCRFFLVSAPAGFGKSTLTSQWLDESNLPFAWLTLDESDNDPIRFWRYLLTSIQTASPGFGTNLQEALLAPQPPSFKSLSNAVINELTISQRCMVIVLDDYHQIENPEIHQSIIYFIEHLPVGIYIAILTREDPPFQISRYRGRADLCEIRAFDLRFSLAETTDFLNQKMHLALSTEEIGALEERTEGWIVGLQLAAISLQSIFDRHTFITDFSGDDRFVADYLIEETLNRQPKAITDFLLKTSLLKRLNADLCNAITGRSDSQDILNNLERINLFITPLDNRREWFRYHHLFADLLRQNLEKTYDADQIVLLKKQISTWFEANHFVIDAVEMAFSNHDIDSAARIIGNSAEFMFKSSQLNLLLKWASALPDKLLQNNPRLCLIFGWAANATTHNELCRHYIALLENHYHVDIAALLEEEDGFAALTAETRVPVVETAVLKTRVSLDDFNLNKVFKACHQIIPYLTPDRDKERVVFNTPSNLYPPMRYIEGAAYRNAGNLNEASLAFMDAINTAKAKNNPHIIALAYSSLGDLQVLQGKLTEAYQTYLNSIQLFEESQLQSMFIAASFIGLGGLAYEWNDLKKASEHIEIGLQMAQLWSSWDTILPGAIHQVRIQIANSDLNSAYSGIARLEKIPHNNYQPLLQTVDLVYAYLDTKRGDLSSARKRLERVREVAASGIIHLFEIGALILARIHLALGQPAEADSLLTNLLLSFEQNARRGRIIEALVLKSLASSALGNQTDAIAILKDALQIAEPEGYLRVFIDEGQPMQDLLAYIVESQPTSYTAQLLTAFPRQESPDPVQQSSHRSQSHPQSQPSYGLLEPLSPREIEILRLIISGSSNNDISGQLFLSLNTVKKHVSNIFGKLEVSSRVQAVERARKLGIIEK